MTAPPSHSPVPPKEEIRSEDSQKPVSVAVPVHPALDDVAVSYRGDLRRISLLLLSITVALVAIFVGADRSLLRPPTYDRHPFRVKDPDSAVERFRGFLRFPTISDPNSKDHIAIDNQATFQGARDYLRTAFPLAHERLSVELVNGHTLLYTWPGSDQSLDPFLYISHYDVVPAAESDGWSHHPFSAAVQDGAIYARGALDVKSGVTWALEAVTALLEAGHAPKRTLMMAFGHDEEVGGSEGAVKVAQMLRDRGTMVAVILDEGGTVLEDGLGGGRLAKGPIAVVGTSEKGYVTVRADILVPEPGHSSMPRLDGLSAATVAAQLIDAVAKRPPKGVLTAPVFDMLRHVAHRSPAALRPLLAFPKNVFSRLVLTKLFRSSAPATAAVTRTTAAVTRASLGVADNVVPATASVTINFRLLPGVSLDYPIEYLRRMLGGNAKYVTLTMDAASGTAAPVADASGAPFALIRRAVLETIPREGESLAVAPFLLVGVTDSRHYADLCIHGTFRANQSAGDLKRIHGIDEKIAIEDYVRGIAFYYRAFELFTTETF